MNFLEMVRAVRKRAKLQGTGPDSVDTTGEEAGLVLAVHDAWIDIQNMRKFWMWMRTERQFLMVVGKSTYTTTESLGPNPRLGKWLVDTFYITVNNKKSKLRYLPYDIYKDRHINDSGNTLPHEFTIRPSDDALIFPSPNVVYTISCEYQKSAQELTTNTEVPELPTRFHWVIVYKALEEYGASIGYFELQTKYDEKYFDAIQELLASQNPATGRLKSVRFA